MLVLCRREPDIAYKEAQKPADVVSVPTETAACVLPCCLPR